MAEHILTKDEIDFMKEMSTGLPKQVAKPVNMKDKDEEFDNLEKKIKKMVK